jgi:hypothetical protein
MRYFVSDAMSYSMSKFELTEEQYNEVIRLSGVYYREAKRCMGSKAYLAGCIMMGAALEATLLAFANCYSDEALRSTIAPTKRGKIKPLADWRLQELLAVAKEQRWLQSSLSPNEEWNNKKAQIGDWAEVLREIRNLIHPVRHMFDLPRNRITKRYLETAFEIFEVATDYLLNKIYESLRLTFEADKQDRNTTRNSHPTN